VVFLYSGIITFIRRSLTSR